MATPRGQLYCKSLALLICLQNIERCISGNYNIDLPEMEFLASNLSPQDCYDFYTQLSHRKANRGGISLYAQKEKMQQLPCISLLTTWLTDPEESHFRSHENIELKLRNIGRKDLARWIVKKIENSLQRKRRLDNEKINRRREESEQNGSIVVNRTGEKIMPIVYLEDEETGIKGENIGDDVKNNSRVFWQIFFSVLILLLLILLFACFYKFFYRKLRCICRRFDSSEDRKCCLPDQNYGTTSGGNLSPKKTQKTCNFFSRKINEKKNFGKIINNVCTEKFSSANESNEEMCIIEENKALMLNLANKLSRRNSKHVFSKSRLENLYPNEKSSSGMTKNSHSTKSFNEKLQQKFRKGNKFLTVKKALNSRSENIFHWKKSGCREFTKIDSEKMLKRSFSDNQLNFSRSTSSRIFSSRKMKENERESDKINFSKNDEEKNPKWTICSCNELSEPEKQNSPPNSKQRMENFPRIPKLCNSQSEIFSEDENAEWNSCSCNEMSDSQEKNSLEPNKIFPNKNPTNPKFPEEKCSQIREDFNSQSEVKSLQEKTPEFPFSVCNEISECQQKNSLASTKIVPTKNVKNTESPNEKSSKVKDFDEKNSKWISCSCNEVSESELKNSLDTCENSLTKNAESSNERSSNIKNLQEKTPNWTFCSHNELPQSQTKNSLDSSGNSLAKNAELPNERCSNIKNLQENTANWTLCSHNEVSQSQTKNSLNSSENSLAKNTELPNDRCSNIKNLQEETANWTLCSHNKVPQWQTKNSLGPNKIYPEINSQSAESSQEKSSKIRNYDEKTSKWIFFTCNEVPEFQAKNSLDPDKITPTKNAKNAELPIEKCPENTKNDYLRYSRGDADSELSETYNELGMLFSEEIKRQWRPCRRNYCPLSRNLRMSGNHDEKKCRSRFRANFRYKIMKIDERPACSSAEICRDTYDEFELMKATKEEREKVTRLIFARRKQFLDQPCLSPVSGDDFEHN